MTLRSCDVGTQRRGTTRIGEFLAEYAAWLCGCGATCARMEKNVKRIAATYGFDVLLTIMPRHVSVVLQRADGTCGRSFTRQVEQCGINFDLNTELSALSWRISDNDLGISAAQKQFSAITGKKYSSGAHVVFLTSLANASFCRLFGGDAVAMSIVFLATMAGYILKILLLRCRVDVRVVFFLCALLSSALCGLSTEIWPGSTPDIALATAVLYLIPGVPYINAASDLIARHYLSAMSRCADAVVLTACLSVGMWAGIKLCALC